MNEQEKEQVQKRIKYSVSNSNSIGSNLVIKFWGEELNELKVDSIDREAKRNLFSFIKTVNNFVSKNSKMSILDTYYDYFYEDGMSDEEKDKIKELVNSNLFNASGAGKKIVVKLYGSNYDDLQNVELNNAEKKELNRFTKNLVEKVKIGQVIRKRTFHAKTFFDYFYDESMKEEEKAELNEKVKKIVFESDNQSKDIAIKKFGPNLDKLQDIDLDKSEQALLLSLKRQVKKTLVNPSIIEFLPTFYDYFYEDDMTEKEKTIIRNRVKKYLDTSNAKGVEVIKKIYLGNVYKIPDVSLSKEEIKEFFHFKSAINKSLKIQMNKDKNLYNCQTFFENFYKENMTEEEKRSLDQKIKNLVDNCSLEGKKVAYQLYGKDLNDIQYAVINDNEKEQYNELKKYVRILLNKKTEIVRFNQYPKTFYDYFYKPTMSSEEKAIIRKRIFKFTNVTNSKSREVIYKLYGENLDKLRDVTLTADEKMELNAYKNLVKMHLKTPIKNIRYFILEDSFFEYFYNENTTDEEKAIIKAKIIQYFETTKSKSKDLIINLYGENLDKLQRNKITEEEKKQILYIKNYIISNLDKIDLEKKKEKAFQILPSFYDYFYKDGMTEEEKAIIREKIKLYDNCFRNAGKQIAKIIYGDDLDQFNNINITKEEKKNFRKYIDSIKISLSKKRKNIKFLNSFYEYFYTYETPEAEKNKIEKIVKNYLDSSVSLGKAVVIKLYGENYDKYTKEKITKEEKNAFNMLKHCIVLYIKNKVIDYNNSLYEYFYKDGMTNEEKGYINAVVDMFFANSKSEGKPIVSGLYDNEFNLLEKPLIEMNMDNRRKFNRFISICQLYINSCKESEDLKDTFFEYMYKPNMTDEQKDIVKEKVKIYLSKTNSSCKNLVIKIYGENYDELKKGIILTKEERALLNSFKANIRIFVNNEKYSDKKINAITNDQIIEKYKECNNVYITIKELNITKKDFAKCFISEFDSFDNVVDILKDVISDLSNADIKFVLDKILEESDLTESEKNLIYLKLLQINDKKITDKIISSILLLDKNDITDYTIMSKDDRVNSLNYFLGKPVYKVREEQEEIKPVVINEPFIEETKEEIKQEVIEEKSADSSKKNNKNSNALPTDFYEIFYNETMDDKQKEHVKKYVYYSVKTSNSAGAKIVLDIYGLNLDNYNQDFEFEYKQRTLYTSFINDLKYKVDVYEMKFYIPTFYERFYTKDSSEDDKKRIIDLVNQILPEYPYKGLSLVYKLYGPNLDELQDAILEGKETQTFTTLVSYVRKQLDRKLSKKDIDEPKKEEIEIIEIEEPDIEDTDLEPEKIDIQDNIAVDLEPEKDKYIVSIGERNNSRTKNKKKEFVRKAGVSTIKKMFEADIKEIGQYIYVRMNKATDINERRKAIKAWDILENISNKSSNDEEAIAKMRKIIDSYNRMCEYSDKRIYIKK